jgi:glycosyltransferase involved in cell wall biosynthesis
MNKVSIITVTYNSASTIRDTLESVANQTYTNIEHIIIDGLSNDNTLEIVKEYPHVEKVISEKDNGIYDAMNKGITFTTGVVIGILNSDDIYENEDIIKDVAKCFENESVDAVYGDLSYFKTEAPKKIERVWNSKSYYEHFFEDGEVPPHPTLFVKKKVYETIGTYYPYFKIASDYEFMFRMFKIHDYKTIYLNKRIVKMRLGGESTQFHNLILNNKEVLEAWKMNNLNPPIKFFFKRPLKKILQLIQNVW